MGGRGIRAWLLVGAGCGILAALGILLLNGTIVAFLLETVLAVVAGAGAVYLGRQAPVAVAVAVDGAPGSPSTPRNVGVREGVAAGATVGVLAGIALTIVAGELIYSANFQEQLAGTFQRAGLQAGSGGGFLALITGCAACFYIFVLPAIAAGFGALGAWIMGLIRPAAAPPAAPPAALPPLPAGPPSESV